MSLYDSILNYTRAEATVLFKEFFKESEKDPSTSIDSSKLDIFVEGYLARSKFLLDKAYRLGSSTLTEVDLDSLVDNLIKIDEEYFGFALYKDHKNLLDARMNWVKVNVEFYQELIKQEGQSFTFEEAARKQFGDKMNYRQALQPIIKADRKMYDVLSELMPSKRERYERSFQLSLKKREEIINTLFCN